MCCTGDNLASNQSVVPKYGTILRSGAFRPTQLKWVDKPRGWVCYAQIDEVSICSALRRYVVGWLGNDVESRPE